MATSSGGYIDQDIVGEAGPLVAGVGVWTALLTASLLGVVGLVSGTVVGLFARLPLYVLGGSVSFVVVLFVLNRGTRDVRATLARAVGAALATVVLGLLGAEGVVYALTDPGSAVLSHLFVYLLSTALVVAGLGCWSVRNWDGGFGTVGDDHL